MDRRTLIKASAAAGAAAWAAPVIIDSLASPAAAYTPGACGTIVGTTAYGFTTSGGQTSVATSGGGNANNGQLTASTSQVVLILLTVAIDGTGANPIGNITGPFTTFDPDTTTAERILTNAASDAAWVDNGDSHYMYAFWARGNGTSSVVTVTVNSDRAVLMAAVLNGVSTSGPTAKPNRNSDITAAYANPSWQLSTTATSGRCMILFGELVTNVTTGGAPGTGGNTWNTITNYTRVLQVATDTSTTSTREHRSVFYVGPSATPVTGTTNVANSGPWGTIVFELVSN